MAEKLKQADFQAFNKLYNAIQRVNQEERQDAVGLLTPSLLRKHLKSGTPITLPYGRKGHTVTFSQEDLKAFDENLKRAKVRNKSGQAGVPLLQLERASHKDDKRRMREEIRAALLFRVRGNELSFQVSASPQSDRQHHRVRIRLEEWFDQLTEGRTWLSAARTASVGRISFECSCGRHQYWYRYLATVSNCAITPKEKDFPKIRNPKLQGFCCKHVLKALQQLKGGAVHKLLAEEMRKQADAEGYADSGKTKFLNAKELNKMKRARGTAKETEAAKRAYKQFNQARKAFKKKVADKDMKKELDAVKAQLKARKAKEKALKARAQSAERKAQRDAIANRLRGFLDAMDSMDVSREEAVAKFAVKNEMTAEDVAKVVTEYSL